MGLGRGRRTRRLLGTAWEWVSSRLFTAALVVGCCAFAVDSVVQRVSVRAFARHVAEMAGAGGGVLFVFQPADCVATAELSKRVAEILFDEGIPVRGLIIRNGLSRSGFELIRKSADERFLHHPTTLRGAVAYTGRAGTPMALGIGSDGSIGTMERFGLLGPEGASELADRLIRAAMAGRP